MNIGNKYLETIWVPIIHSRTDKNHNLSGFREFGSQKIIEGVIERLKELKDIINPQKLSNKNHLSKFEHMPSNQLMKRSLLMRVW